MERGIDIRKFLFNIVNIGKSLFKSRLKGPPPELDCTWSLTGYTEWNYSSGTPTPEKSGFYGDKSNNPFDRTTCSCEE